MEIRTITGKVRHSLVSAAQYYGRSVIRESLIIRIVTRRRRSPYSQKSKPIKRKNWSSQSFVRGSTLLVKLEVLKNMNYSVEKVMEILNTTGMLIFRADGEDT